jgi:hypothetical protein
MRFRASVLVGATLLLAATPRAEACGVCIEDNIAVTYDHAVVEAAVARGHVIVFATIDTRAAVATAAHVVKSAATRAHGVDRGTVRTAPEPLAVSFALDPGVQSPAAALLAIENAAALPGLRLTLVRVVR